MSPNAAFSAAHSDGFSRISSEPVESSDIDESRNPIDLVHLSKQSLGDRELEREILYLFHSQSELYLERLANARERAERRLAAHTIVGSARGIGAWKVAKDAAKLVDGHFDQASFDKLSSSLECAREYICDLLDDH